MHLDGTMLASRYLDAGMFSLHTAFFQPQRTGLLENYLLPGGGMAEKRFYLICSLLLISCPGSFLLQSIMFPLIEMASHLRDTYNGWDYLAENNLQQEKQHDGH